MWTRSCLAWIFFTLALLGGSKVSAQIDYRLTLVPSFNTTFDSLYVDVMMARRSGSAPFELGTSNFVFDVNGSGIDLSTVSSDQIVRKGRWSATQTSAKYDQMTLTKGGLGNYLILNTYAKTGVAPPGVPVPDTNALIARLALPIANCAQNHGLTWRSQGDVTTYSGASVRSYGTFVNPTNGPLHPRLTPPFVNYTSTQSSITFSWPAVKLANRYEVSLDSGSTWTSIGAQTNYTISGLMPETVADLTVRAIGNFNGCSDTASSGVVLGITQNCSPLTYHLTPDTTLCAASSVTLRVRNVQPSGSYQVAWAGGAYTNNFDFTFSPTTDTLVYVAIRNTSVPSCTYLDSVLVRINPLGADWHAAGFRTSFCLADNPIELIPDFPGGVFTGPGVFYNTSLDKYYFKASLVGPGDHAITYAVCNQQVSQTFSVADAPCVTTVVAPGSGFGGGNLLRLPQSLFTACDGSIYVSDSEEGVVRRIDTLGRMTIIAGTPQVDSNNVGTVMAGQSYLRFPVGVVALTNGDVYIADAENHVIKKVSNGLVSVVAGSSALMPAPGHVPLMGQAAVPGTQARFNFPTGLAVDPNEEYLYIADSKNWVIKRYALATGEVVTFAGDGTYGFRDGTATVARFGQVVNMAADRGNLFLADDDNLSIRRIKINSTNPTEFNRNVVSTLTNRQVGFRDGPFSGAGAHQMRRSLGVSVDGSANVYFADTDNHSIRRVDTLGNVVTIAGNIPPADTNNLPGYADGAPDEARFFYPTALSVYINGFIDIADSENGAIRRLAIDNFREGIWNGLNPDFQYCLNEATDTLRSLYPGGVFSGDPDLLKWVNGRYLFVPSKVGTFEMTYTYAVGPCTQVFRQLVTISPRPVVTLNAEELLCGEGASVILIAGADSLTYAWSGPNGPIASTDSAIVVTEPGQYYVMGRNAAGCGTSATVLVKRVEATPVQIISPAPVCAGTAVVLRTQPAGFVSYRWNNGSTADSLVITSGGRYSVTAVDANGCSFSDTLTYNFTTIDASLTASGGICAGVAAALRVEPRGTGYLYYWAKDGNALGVSSNPDTTVLGEGVYSVRVQDPSGCLSAVRSVTIQIGTPPVAAILPPAATGQCVGVALTLDASASTGTLFQWFRNGVLLPGATNSTLQITDNGTYRVLVSNAQGCSAQAQYDVTSYYPPLGVSLDVVGTEAFCVGDSVTLTALVAQASANITGYQWLKNGNPIAGATDSTYKAYEAGIYRVIAYDANCSDTSAADAADTLLVNPRPSKLTLTASKTALCPSGDFVRLTVTGGTGATRFQWLRNNVPLSMGSRKDTLVTGGGTYKVIAYNTNYCDTTSNEVTLLVLPKPTVTLASLSGDSACVGDIIQLKTGGSTTLASYKYFRNGVPITGQITDASPSFLFYSTGTYKVVAFDSSGCNSDSAQVRIVARPQPFAALVPVGEVSACTNNTVTLSAASSNAGPNARYRWIRNGVADATSSASAELLVNKEGRYRVIVYNQMGCSDTSAVLVLRIRPTPVAAIQPADSALFCIGGSTVLTAVDSAGTADSYEWLNENGSMGVGTSEIQVSQPGWYRVVITNSAGCSDTSAAVRVAHYSDLPVARLSQIGGKTCPGSPIAFTHVGSENTVNIQYLRNGEPITDVMTPRDTFFMAQGQYQLVAFSAAGCSDTSAAVAPAFYRPPFAAIVPAQPQYYCAGDGGVAMSAATSAPGDTTIMGYQWLRYVGNVATPVAGITTNADTILSAGNFQVAVFDHNGCSDTSAVVQIIQTARPVAVLSQPVTTTACEGDSIRLSAGASREADSFEWLRNGVSVYKGTTKGDSIFYAAESGTYALVATNAGCSDTSVAVVSLSIAPRPELTLAAVTYACDAPSVTLNAGNPGARFRWNTGDTTQTLVVTTAGFYSVAITTPGGCTDSARTEVRFLTIPGRVEAQELGASCADETIALAATSSGNELEITWTTNGTGTLRNADQLTASYEPGPGDLDQVQFIITVRNPCGEARDTVTATILPSTEATFSYDPDAVLPGDPIRFTPLNLDPAHTYTWAFGDGTSSSEPSPVKSYPNEGKYRVWLTLQNQYGCRDTASVIVEVIRTQVVFVPNIFDPQADNPHNRTLRVYGTSIQSGDFMFRVYDRWGELLYETSSFEEANQTGWTGRRNNAGDLLPVGAYTYMVKGKFLDGTPFEKVGTATLIQ
ncbi:NHL repeat-containing protein [Catalinimonas alkaloidigena]|uniref:NHL repeat-containing protein n=1 Tax=Catalinimonas alkaloidigena TaxID=1075417 RepID=A0A1G9GYA6_9BACT|nr:PKD domain-containing protein [Catalinimonas alkaloidigena]SDL05575.1 NHL repeat-containing protein [Catalinimonas alkaloidigena]